MLLVGPVTTTIPNFEEINIIVHASDETTWAVQEIHREMYSNDFVFDFWYNNRTGYGQMSIPVYMIDLNYTIRVHKLTNNSDFFEVQFSYWDKYTFKSIENGTGYVEECFDTFRRGPDVVGDPGIYGPYDLIIMGIAALVLLIVVCVKDGKGKKDSGDRSRSKKSVQEDEGVSKEKTYWDW